MSERMSNPWAPLPTPNPTRSGWEYYKGHWRKYGSAPGSFSMSKVPRADVMVELKRITWCARVTATTPLEWHEAPTLIEAMLDAEAALLDLVGDALP